MYYGCLVGFFNGHIIKEGPEFSNKIQIEFYTSKLKKNSLISLKKNLPSNGKRRG